MTPWSTATDELLAALLDEELLENVFTKPLKAVLSSSVLVVPEDELELLELLELDELTAATVDSEEDSSPPQPVSMMAAEITEKTIRVWIFFRVIFRLGMGLIDVE